MKRVQMKYRRRMNVVEAWRLESENHEIPVWIVEAITSGTIGFVDEGRRLWIHSTYSRMIVERGSWIIRGSNGGLHSCGDDAFWEAYEEVSE